MDTDALVDLFVETGTLKHLQRTGWALRGVSHVESIADHSFGVALMALILAETLNGAAPAGRPALDVEKVLAMAVLHDLAEVRLTDLPVSAVRLLSTEVKSQAEVAAMAEILAPLPETARLVALWQEFEERSSPEGQLVRDADKLEMMVQCLRYESAGSTSLGEFWQAMDQNRWNYDLCAGLYARLKALRPVGRG